MTFLRRCKHGCGGETWSTDACCGCRYCDCDKRSRDARWLRVVRRLWRQRDNLVNALRQLEATAERGDCMGCAKTADDLRYMYDQRDALRTQCETHANAYEDEHRRATRLQERVSWLESQRQWVDVRERLPEVGTCALLWWVSDGYGTSCAVATLTNDCGEYVVWESERGHWYADDDGAPTHWQPLPEPPEEPCDD